MIVAADDLLRFARDVLARAGLRPQNAQTVAALLVRADLQGLVTHGVSRLGYYLARMDAGVMEVDPDPVVETDLPSAALLDARNGWGQIAADRAMRLAIDKARLTGIAAVSVAHSNHFGVAGHYVELATEAGLIGIAMTNASPAMAPFNAKEALLGTNPLAIGIPTASAPIVLDMSSSVVARGKIRRAYLEGNDTIPEGWANDRDGIPTTDPREALEGLLAPIGGAKGTGLALMIDLLSGVLSGTAPTGSVTNIIDVSKPSDTGHLLIALDPNAFIGRDRFARDVTEVAERITAMSPADGTAVLLPGQRELERIRAARRDGVRVSSDVVDDLRRIARRFEVPEPAQAA